MALSAKAPVESVRSHRSPAPMDSLLRSIIFKSNIVRGKRIGCCDYSWI